jgi:quercetin dioxygenase-like cupin family protein
MPLTLLMALTAAAPAATGPVTHAQIDVPRTNSQQVVVQSREFAPEASSGWHVHAGTEIAYVISGEMELVTAERVIVLKPGDSFTMPRGVAHNGRNAGAVPAQIVITLVVDKRAPLRTAVPAPNGR